MPRLYGELASWTSVFRDAGFDVELLRDPWERDVFVGTRPGSREVPR